MAHDIRIVTEADLRGAVGLDGRLVDAIERAFAALASDEVVMPPILSVALAEACGEVDVETAYIPGVDGVAIRVSPGAVDTAGPGLSGVTILCSARTGAVQAVFLDNGYLTELRTAAAGAVAARHLAPRTVETAGVLGTGVQARLQMRAAHLVRPFKRLLVWGRDPGKAAACAAELGATLGVEVEMSTDAQEVVLQSQLVVTTTPTRSPIVRAEWLHPGLHITAVGSDRSGKQEVEPAALAAAHLYVCDRVCQCEVSGELEGARAAGLWNADDPSELGAIIAKTAPGRERPDDITICDLTGTGAQDTAIAAHAMSVLDGAATVVRA
ncbi:ornithine cyclodeaminase family protein [Psychromarinibacter sp. C21-152]|uniref:Ornithine cyclodeaminase family protein n=1 Tax=Psychromarinibacter sediminicola TaxID=3033385 RepID=A0AAE3NVW0_9RHOB|nr:ornithine cyclodeaminase family protein [Psychromarinibacter sediminicola]MDF0603071.1 ornithine cyclodeaminase family protein [Psychromarinibacter sediminicola]